MDRKQAITKIAKMLEKDKQASLIINSKNLNEEQKIKYLLNTLNYKEKIKKMLRESKDSC